LKWTTEHFTKGGVAAPRLEAEVLLAHAAGCKRIELYTRFDEPAEEGVRARFRELVRERGKGCPVAYLVGRKEFFSLEFEVTRDVLIPRPETETLVMACLEAARPEASILDVGTGSGILAVTLARQLRHSSVTAIDVSPSALEVAKRNAARHGVAERIRFLQGDLLEPLQEGERFDIIVSNPPYISSARLAELEPSVRDFEPRLALDGGPDGLEVLGKIARAARGRLRPAGRLLLEFGVGQGQAMLALLTELGFVDVKVRKDHADLPRVVQGVWPG
jgi:release factor glutamine methyltransferase